MRTIGLIGGMSWESTVTYYQLLNRGVQSRLGGLHSAELLLHSVDFALIETLQRSGDWGEAGRRLGKAAAGLETAGAELMVLATNTMHLVAPAVESAISIPFIHIVDPTGEALTAAGIGRVGLLGTRFTMEQAFYRQRLAERFGLSVIIPEERERATVHRIIFEELCLGVVSDASRRTLQEAVKGLAAEGAEAVILGCTELGLLASGDELELPTFDTTALHADRAVTLALQ